MLAKEDRLIALEFKTELDEDEQRVFAWLVEGLQYRAVASVLNIPVNEARNTARSCERKRERFQLLYDTGRLCGYSAQTILALQNGEATSEVLAERAFAHLESCAHCRLEHKTNAKRLRRSFRDQAAALLPPVFIGHLGWLARLGLRARTSAAPPRDRRGCRLGQGGVRERAVALLAGGGVGAKVAVGVVTVGVLAGGAVATHVLEQSPSPHRHHVARSAAAAPRAAPATGRLLSAAPAASLSTSVHRSSADLQAPAPFQPPASACEHPADEQHERRRAARTGRVCLPRRPHEHQPCQHVSAGGEHLSAPERRGSVQPMSPVRKFVGRFVAVGVIDPRSPTKTGLNREWTRR